MTIYIKDGKIVEHADNPDAESSITIEAYRKKLQQRVRLTYFKVDIDLFFNGIFDEKEAINILLEKYDGFSVDGALWTTKDGDFAAFLKKLREGIEQDSYEFFINHRGIIGELIRKKHLVWLIGEDGYEELHFNLKYSAMLDIELKSPMKLRASNRNLYDQSAEMDYFDDSDTWDDDYDDFDEDDNYFDDGGDYEDDYYDD